MGGQGEIIYDKSVLYQGGLSLQGPLLYSGVARNDLLWVFQYRVCIAAHMLFSTVLSQSSLDCLCSFATFRAITGISTQSVHCCTHAVFCSSLSVLIRLLVLLYYIQNCYDVMVFQHRVCIAAHMLLSVVLYWSSLDCLSSCATFKFAMIFQECTS